MALEQVALLDGLPLKEGLRREAGALARELSGWMGRVEEGQRSGLQAQGKLSSFFLVAMLFVFDERLTETLTSVGSHPSAQSLL